MVPNLAADGEGPERVGDAPLTDQFLHKQPVELSLVGGHPHEEDVLALRRQRLSQHLMAASGKQDQVRGGDGAVGGVVTLST